MSLDIKWEKEPQFNLILSDDVTPLKEFIVDYVGNKIKSESDEVTVNMIVDTLADEFPELVFSVAEENWVRGYEQGLKDLKAFEEE